MLRKNAGQIVGADARHLRDVGIRRRSGVERGAILTTLLLGLRLVVIGEGLPLRKLLSGLRLRRRDVREGFVASVVIVFLVGAQGPSLVSSLLRLRRLRRFASLRAFQLAPAAFQFSLLLLFLDRRLDANVAAIFHFARGKDANLLVVANKVE